MESLIITANVACVVYLCWCLFKGKPDKPAANDLGVFAFKDEAETTGGKR
ncbi:hypothetical protein [Acidovorax sp.]|nr:hypothetical protein [Acidovorax sp.]